jgi:hypothetical protein
VRPRATEDRRAGAGGRGAGPAPPARTPGPASAFRFRALSRDPPVGGNPPVEFRNGGASEDGIARRPDGAGRTLDVSALPGRRPVERSDGRRAAFVRAIVREAGAFRRLAPHDAQPRVTMLGEIDALARRPGSARNRDRGQRGARGDGARAPSVTARGAVGRSERRSPRRRPDRRTFSDRRLKGATP